MRPLLSPEEMARADDAAISGGTPVEVLMERAGRATARAAIRVSGSRYGKRAAVVCGKGNNGGDGFTAARVLSGEGLGVVCMAVADPREATGAPAEHLRRLRAAGLRVEDFDAARLRAADVVVDAIFGTGFTGKAEGLPAEAIDAINECGAPVVAVDVPSGVNGGTGAVEGPAVRAEVTVAMAAEKLGTALPPGALRAGAVEVADIGIRVTGARTFMAGQRDVAAVLPARAMDAHKRSSGAVALLAGRRGMTGAAILAARGAVRMGAGYATVGGTAEVDAAVASVLPEVLSEVVTDSDVLGPEALASFSQTLERAAALALGPGLGRGEGQRALVEEALAKVDLPVVVDADGLNVLARHTSALEDRAGETVITPHPAELARLLDVTTGDVLTDRLGSARTAAERFDCVVVLKGYRTVTAAPDGTAVVNPTGGPELATAGTGDVLTGAIAALLAAGLEPFVAAWASVFVHGIAGGVAASETGDVGALAMDVAESLPEARSLVLAPLP
ncbi:MAG: NAD(P)H-hydrate dehydratase [Actinomycetota bacterium]